MNEPFPGRPVVVGLGEVLWDVLPDAKHLGGAPFNFAFHAGQLGAEAFMVSRVGDDDDGREIRRRMAALGMSDRYVQTDRDHPTGYVPVTLDEAGIPTFTIVEDVAYDYLTHDPALVDLAARADVVCFGTLAQRNAVARETIQEFLAGAGRATIVYDINFRQHYYSREVVEASLGRSHILKLNEEELPTLCELVAAPGDDGPAALGRLRQTYDLAMVCLTLGPAGCVLVTADDEIRSPGYQVDVADTVGSGDAFTAALVMGWLANRPLEDVADRANLAGAYVATQPGATPTVSDSILDALADRNPPRLEPA